MKKKMISITRKRQQEGAAIKEERVRQADNLHWPGLGSFSLLQFLGDLNRLRQIVLVLSRAGFAEVMGRMRVNGFVVLLCRIHCWFENSSCPERDLPRNLRIAFEKLGPSFMKLGQVLSMRPDLVPEPYVKEFSKLQDQAPSFPYDVVKKTTESELKKSLKNVFAQFEREPVACASLGQVHRGKLLDGTRVAVKVQRPQIRKVLEKDMRIISYLIQAMESSFPDVRRLRPRAVLEAFTQSLARELDYTVEGRNADRFRYNFREEKGIVTPKIFWEHTTPKVLTMEYVVGFKLGDHAKLKKHGIDHETLMRNCTRACLLPVFRDGFFHADPHPGNVWALKDSSVCWLDFGMVGSVPKKLRLTMLLFILFLANKDIESTVYYLLEMAEVSEDSNVDGYSEEVTGIITELFARTGTVQTMSSSFFRMVQKAAEYRIYFPAGLVLLAKALVTSETMCRLTHKKYDILETAKPILEEVYQKEFGLSALLAHYQRFIPDLMMFLQKIPELARARMTEGAKASLHKIHNPRLNLS